jgi:crotonobetainyl-CoA:carnitine CoA-transferase CaiB-like acyl-CoA transferase
LDYVEVQGDSRDAPPRPAGAKPLVIDLSALWAGPLCSHLLHLCGADVIKVESESRPDGARFGNTAFYDLLNQGKRSVSLDLTRPEGHNTLGQLIHKADIVIESSRPRALLQMGIDATEVLASTPGLTWISITGYGRREPQANWIAFGDDAGVAAGLSDVMKAATGRYEFAGDAIADPLTGIHAALAAWESWRRGGSRLLSLAMADVTAWCLNETLSQFGATEVTRAFAGWWDHAFAGNAEQTQRPISEHVATLGEDTERVLRELTIRC